jgi:peroxiredoxin
MTASADGKRSGFVRHSSFLLNLFSNFLAMTDTTPTVIDVYRPPQKKLFDFFGAYHTYGIVFVEKLFYLCSFINKNMYKMKKVFIFLSIAFLLAGCTEQQRGYRITATVGNVPDDTEVFLYYRIDGETVTDTAIVKDNRFVFSDTVEEPFSASIEIKREENVLPQFRDMLGLYVEKGEIVLNSPDSIKNAVVTNSKLNDEKQEWQALTKHLRDQRLELSKAYRNASEEEKESEAFNARLEQTSDSLDNEQKILALQFITKHPDSYLNIDQLLRTYLGYYPDGSEADSIFSLLSPAIRQTKAGIEFAKKIEAWKNTSVGAIAPDFTQNDPDGKPIQLSDFKGQYLLIDFWASWCGPCRQENPNVVKAYNQFKDKGFTILGVSLDRNDGREKWLKAIEDDQLTWAHVSDLQYWNNAAAKLYAVNAIPANFLLDTEGKIIGRNLRGEDLVRKLEEVLK